MERFMIYIYQNIHKLKQVFNTLTDQQRTSSDYGLLIFLIIKKKNVL